MHRFVPLSLLALGLLNHHSSGGTGFLPQPRPRVVFALPPSKANAAHHHRTLCPHAGSSARQVVLRQLISPTRWDGTSVHALCIRGLCFPVRPEQGEATALSNRGSDVQIRLIPLPFQGKP